MRKNLDKLSRNGKKSKLRIVLRSQRGEQEAQSDRGIEQIWRLKDLKCTARLSKCQKRPKICSKRTFSLCNQPWKLPRNWITSSKKFVDSKDSIISNSYSPLGGITIWSISIWYRQIALSVETWNLLELSDQEPKVNFWRKVKILYQRERIL